MKAEYSNAVGEALEDAPAAVRKASFKQLGLLVQDLHHPFLHAKKYDNQVTNGIKRDLLQHALGLSLTIHDIDLVSRAESQPPLSARDQPGHIG